MQSDIVRSFPTGICHAHSGNVGQKLQYVLIREPRGCSVELAWIPGEPTDAIDFELWVLSR